MSKETGFKNEIKQYEIIRGFIRQLFQYGDKSSEELAKSNCFGATSNVSYLVRRVRNYLQDDRLIESSIKDNKTSIKNKSLVYDPLSYPINNLTATFQEHTFDISDITFFFTLMQMFVDESYYMDNEDEDPDNRFCLFEDFIEYTFNTFTLKDLIQNFFEILKTKKVFLYKKGQLSIKKKDLEMSTFSESKFRRFFNKLKDDLGIFIDTLPPTLLEKNQNHSINPLTYGKKKSMENIYYYKLSNDIFSHFIDDQKMLKSIYDMVCFFYNQSDIAVPGWQLSNTLRTYIYSNYPATDIFSHEEPIYQFIDNNVLTVLDAEIFWDLVTAIHNHKAVSFIYKTPENELCISVYPIKVISERQYGREYLFAYSYENTKFLIYRLDRISNVHDYNISDKIKYSFLKVEDLNNIDEALKNIYDFVFRDAWNVDISNYENPQTILLHFKTRNENLQNLKDRISSRTSKGIIKNESESGFDFEIKVTNTIEITPWIRSFGSEATVDKEHNPELHNKIKNELTEILTRYESI